MKEVFMPSMDELYQMQDMGANIKLYLYAKAIEALCIEYNNFPRKGSILKNEFKYIRENEIITYAICMMYPNEIDYSVVSQFNPALAAALIDKKENNQIYRLDNISRFSTLAAAPQIKKIIDILSEELPSNPKYRFEYHQSKLNNVLDDIFMGKITLNDIDYCMSDIEREKYMSLLSKIEPFYAMQRKDEDTKKYYMRQAVINYINRYGFNFSIDDTNKDILTNQSTEVKRLFRCIKRK